jgi:replicative DNA helicase
MMSRIESDSPRLTRAVERRAKREPLQYIIGTAYFYGEKYKVTPDCLIPRFDTETLVDYAVKNLPSGAVFMDLCTGSGCVAISVLSHTKDTYAIAVDIDGGALAVAEENAHTNGVSDRIHLRRADLMQEVEGRMFEISQNNLKKEYTQINPVIGRVYELLQKAAARTDGLSGLSTGFDKLDRMTSGWQNSDLIIIAARPAMGKTAFIISMMKKMAVDMKTPVAMFSLEMANEQLVQRLMVNVCEISGEKLRSGNLAPHEWGQLDSRVTMLYDAPIFVDDTPSLSIFELRTKARRLVREHGVKIIMIDYLQLMNASGMSFGSRQEEVSTISRSLKGLAKELNIPIIALSQLNRGVESREGNEGKRPQLSDLRESGAIEQDADIVCFIHRPEYYKIYEDEKGRDMRGVAQFIIAKHRNGSVGDINLNFRSEFARFSDPDERVPLPGETFSSGDMGGGFMSAALTPEEMAEAQTLASKLGGDPLAPGPRDVPF